MTKITARYYVYSSFCHFMILTPSRWVSHYLRPTMTAPCQGHADRAIILMAAPWFLNFKTLAIWCRYLQRITRETRDVDPMMSCCWPSVADGGSALPQHWVNNLFSENENRDRHQPRNVSTRRKPNIKAAIIFTTLKYFCINHGDHVLVGSFRFI